MEGTHCTGLKLFCVAGVLAIAACSSTKSTVTATKTTATTKVRTLHVTAGPKSVPDDVIATAQNSLLSIGCNLPGGGQFQSQGTAWMVAGPSHATLEGRGNAITASHVLTACGQGTNIQSFGPESLSLGQNDVTHDIALLSVSGEIGPPLPISTTPPHVGDEVALLGLAQQQREVTQGMITAVNVPQKLSGDGSVETLPDAILVRTSAIHGESGGPAIDSSGRVVGVIEGGTDTGSAAILTPVSDLPTGATQAPQQPPPSAPPAPTTPSTPATPPGPATPGVNSQSRNCDPNVLATPAMSCPLAENTFIAVWRGYTATGSVPSSVSAQDSSSGQSVQLDCGMRAEVADVVCNDQSDQAAAVEFPLHAVQVYQGP
jgi:hypothetical protein